VIEGFNYYVILIPPLLTTQNTFIHESGPYSRKKKVYYYKLLIQQIKDVYIFFFTFKCCTWHLQIYHLLLLCYILNFFYLGFPLNLRNSLLRILIW